MQISDAVEVIEVFSEDEANERLAEGWRLLAVVPGAPRGSSNRASVVYVLGKPADPTEPTGAAGVLLPKRMRD